MGHLSTYASFSFSKVLCNCNLLKWDTPVAIKPCQIRGSRPSLNQSNMLSWQWEPRNDNIKCVSNNVFPLTCFGRWHTMIQRHHKYIKYHKMQNKYHLNHRHIIIVYLYNPKCWFNVANTTWIAFENPLICISLIKRFDRLSHCEAQTIGISQQQRATGHLSETLWFCLQNLRELVCPTGTFYQKTVIALVAKTQGWVCAEGILISNMGY